jgi:tetratricopeptide (TPR) repeat protein
VARTQFLRRRTDRAGTEDARLALGNLTAAVTLAPHRAEALLRRGRAFQLTGQEEKAIADFRAVLSLDASSSVRYLAHLFLGSVHQTAVQPRLDEARKEYEAALQEAPLAQSARLALSTALLLMGDREGAETLTQETLEFPSETADWIVLDPWSTYGVGQFSAALGTFSRLRTDLWKKQP